MKRRVNHRIKIGRRSITVAVVFFLMGICFFSMPVFAGTDKKKSITGLVETFVQESGATGIQVAFMHKKASHPVTISKGTACLSNDVPMTDDHIFKIGSVSKLFTALRIHTLIQENQLTYDTPISKFFPAFPNGDQILIRHLLTHTSGLAEMLAIPDIFQNLCKPMTPETIMDQVANADPLFVPGTAQQYCNSGYLILGRIVEEITGQPFETNLKTALFTPLGMTHTQQGDDLSVVKKEVSGYNLSPEGNVIKPDMASMIPPFATGNFKSNAKDIVRLVHLGRLLDSNFIDTPVKDFWKLETGKPAVTTGEYQQLTFETGWHDGFIILRFNAPQNMILVGKAGMFPGFCTWFLYDAQTEYGLAMMVNNQTHSMDALILAVNIFQTIRTW